MTNNTQPSDRIDHEIAKAHDNAINALNGRTTQHTTEPSTLRERCEARHLVVNELMEEYRYMSAIRELESIIKMVKEA